MLTAPGPTVEGDWDVLTADVEEIVRVLRAQNAANPDKVGLVGASQPAGLPLEPPTTSTQHSWPWPAPQQCPSGPPISTSDWPVGDGHTLAGGDQPPPQKAGPSAYDPLPDLQRMTMPELWLFGSADDNTPVQESVAVLDLLRGSRHEITVHLDVPPTALAAPTTSSPGSNNKSIELGEDVPCGLVISVR